MNEAEIYQKVHANTTNIAVLKTHHEHITAKLDDLVKGQKATNESVQSLTTIMTAHDKFEREMMEKQREVAELIVKREEAKSMGFKTKAAAFAGAVAAVSAAVIAIINAIQNAA